jgi:hypothetical protein
MATRKHNWTWRRLADNEASAQRRPRATNWRRADKTRMNIERNRILFFHNYAGFDIMREV